MNKSIRTPVRYRARVITPMIRACVCAESAESLVSALSNILQVAEKALLKPFPVSVRLRKKNDTSSEEVWKSFKIELWNCVNMV